MAEQVKNFTIAAADETEPLPEGVDGWWLRQRTLSRTLYWGVHVASISVFWVGFEPWYLALFAASFFVRMFGITGAYHRYFAHKTYKTSRPFQFLIALLATTAVQKGPLWWAAAHRIHHKYADRPGDVHSPSEGFWHAHNGWIFCGLWDDSKLQEITDFARYPELMWLNRWHIVPPAVLLVLCGLIGGSVGIVWGFVLPTVALWHSTYCVNSIAHIFGRRRYDTPDTSRNNWLVGLLTMGEGWHNNHHHYCVSARQGFFWWEVDATYYILRGLAAVGLIWDIREPPAHVVRSQTRTARAS